MLNVGQSGIVVIEHAINSRAVIHRVYFHHTLLDHYQLSIERTRFMQGLCLMLVRAALS